MTLLLELSIRLVGAGLIGAAIGYERELRAKEAGVRTHVLVALGSALFMVVSQYGFPADVKFDAARIAAQVVTGIGFLGGGLILKRDHVSGLTTAAGLWVTSVIGLGMGGGMYALSVLCAVLVLVVMEYLNFYTVRYGDKEVHIVISSAREKALMDAIMDMKAETKHFSLNRQGEVYRASLTLLIPKRKFGIEFIERIKNLPEIDLEVIE